MWETSAFKVICLILDVYFRMWLIAFIGFFLMNYKRVQSNYEVFWAGWEEPDPNQFCQKKDLGILFSPFLDPI